MPHTVHRRVLLTASLAAPFVARDAVAQANVENTLYLDLKDGRVTIEMRPDLAPRHVERIKTLSRQGFYDNTPFHRVIEGFMAQGGDPTGTGRGGSPLPNIPAEFTPPARARFIRGTCGMARSQSPDSANSQFFIMFGPYPSLDGQYTIWGRVVGGMDAVDKITRGEPPRTPDRIIRMRAAADAG